MYFLGSWPHTRYANDSGVRALVPAEHPLEGDGDGGMLTFLPASGRREEAVRGSHRMD